MMGKTRVKAAWMAATFFYIGCLKPAPGTLASIATIPFALLLWRCGAPIYAAATVFVGFFGYWAVKTVLDNRPVAESGEKADDDPSYIVVDEVLGALIAAFLPFSLLQIAIPLPLLALYSFAAFRLFDIFKPFNIGWIDKNIRGAAGVMLDDAVAGLYAGVGVTLVVLLAL
ncbi:MAG: phosphatidylglycerophosphatase A [Deferribacteraceae bacterium]|jgi:phosphatidylglycerophosphatase A|nr:phosphatidylglycerophosphatase A [Deferribacteraceae bacterium]